MAVTLTRSLVVEGAVALVDEGGAGALSMRRLADHLGCGTMSLYNHVEGRDDLLAAALEAVLADVPQPAAAEGDWRTPLREVAGWLRATLQAHPWACDLWPTTWPGANRTALMEVVLRSLRLGGFDRRMAHHGFHALDLFVVGHVHQQAQFAAMLEDPGTTVERFLAQTPPAEFPYVIEHVAHHADEDVDEDDFAFLLELLLDGLAQHRDD